MWIGHVHHAHAKRTTQGQLLFNGHLKTPKNDGGVDSQVEVKERG